MTPEPKASQPREPDWLSVEDAQERILARIAVLDSESVPIAEALGRILAEDVQSTIAHPPWDNSAMDGYAVRAADIAAATRERPVTLRVIEEVAAGRFPKRSVSAGEAIKVMTGAPVPESADGVTRIEHTQPGPEPDTISVFDAGDAGRNIRRRGEDLEIGDRPLDAGTTLRPAEIGVLAMLGRSEMQVYHRAKVAILSTGDELADFDEFDQVEAGEKIMNSNSYALAAQVIDAGAEPIMLGIARDDRDSMSEHLRAARGYDALITSAGLAVGDHDYVKEALNELGMEFLFYRVLMRPGSPFTFGVLDSMPVFALPGNSVSALVTFEILVRPALKKMMGRRDAAIPWRKIRLAEAVTTRGRLTHFYRVKLEQKNAELLARLTGPQGSGILTSMTQADALIEVPANSELPAGTTVKALFLGRK